MNNCSKDIKKCIRNIKIIFYITQQYLEFYFLSSKLPNVQSNDT